MPPVTDLQPPSRPLTVALPTAAELGLPGLAPGPAPVQSGRPIDLTAGDYRLRSLTVADVTPRVVAWFEEPRLLEGLNLPPLGFDADRLRHFVAGFDHRHHHLVGIFDATVSPARLVGFYTVDVNPAHRTGLMTTAIGDSDYLGRRVLWATIDVLLDHLFEQRGLDKISSRVLARNRRMLFNFINNESFVCEGLLREECLAPDGQRVDILMFSAFRTHRRDGRGAEPRVVPEGLRAALAGGRP